MKSPAPQEAKLASERVLGWQTKLHRWAGQDEQARFDDLFNPGGEHRCLTPASRAAIANPVESRMCGNAQVRFRGRAGETDRRQRRHRAPTRPYVCLPTTAPASLATA